MCSNRLIPLNKIRSSSRKGQLNKRAQVSSKHELWIGFAKVEQRTRGGVLGDADKAYTNVIAKAGNRLNFRVRVAEGLAELGLKLIRLEDAETLKERLSKWTIDPELMKVADEVDVTGDVGFGTFHTFDSAAET